ncbi:enoyl-CoA hydratase-related protein [Flocculibacter collagenilyticus]|uniref:enoyl-CoA hydratase-related protein n=1 Tax=Flocculibacter collagenilyticus TaxID=2744479 RepID=UPI0018F36DD4|nr:enoyl-CoA hydratase-related protein [Flocculibacter collagenilyticus]
MPLVNIRIEDHIGIIMLNNPAKSNLMSAKMSEEFQQAVSQLESNEKIKAIFISGEGSAFCAGADLSDLIAAHDGEGEGIRAIYDAFMAVAYCNLPTIAGINGVAVGAGMNLALACDIRLATPDSYLDTRFMKIGIHPGGGHTWMLPKTVGWQQSVNLLLLSNQMSGAEAEKCGLVLKCVSKANFMPEVKLLTNNLTHTPKEVLVRTKRSLRENQKYTSQQDALEAEFSEQMWSLQQPDAHEMISRLKERISSKNKS